jgi:hypothetical protein
MATGFTFKFNGDTSNFNRKVSTMQSKTLAAVNAMKSAFLSLAPALSVAAIAAWTKEVARAAVELERFSTISGLTVEQMQAIDFVAGTLGLEGEKLADIFKDVNDKFGDFTQNQAGPLKDFFEKVAPKVGLTVEAFKGLNAKDILQLYISSLEKANVSQAEMIFYMEAIASDASALIPLFKDNGKELENLVGRFNETGGAIDELSNKKLANLDRRFNEVMRSIQTESKKALVAIVDAFNGDFNGLLEFIEKWGIRFNVFFAERIDAVLTNLNRFTQTGGAILDGFAKMIGATMATGFETAINSGLRFVEFLQELPLVVGGPLTVAARAFGDMSERIDASNEKIQQGKEYITGYGSTFTSQLSSIWSEQNKVSLAADHINDLYGDRLETLENQYSVEKDILDTIGKQKDEAGKLNEKLQNNLEVSKQTADALDSLFDGLYEGGGGSGGGPDKASAALSQGAASALDNFFDGLYSGANGSPTAAPAAAPASADGDGSSKGGGIVFGRLIPQTDQLANLSERELFTFARTVSNSATRTMRRGNFGFSDIDPNNFPNLTQRRMRNNELNEIAQALSDIIRMQGGQGLNRQYTAEYGGAERLMRDFQNAIQDLKAESSETNNILRTIRSNGR